MRDFNRACLNKIRHRTQEDAELHVNGLEAEGTLFIYQVYRCPYCSNYHVGKKSNGYGRGPRLKRSMANA